MVEEGPQGLRARGSASWRVGAGDHADRSETRVRTWVVIDSASALSQDSFREGWRLIGGDTNI